MERRRVGRRLTKTITERKAGGTSCTEGQVSGRAEELQAVIQC